MKQKIKFYKDIFSKNPSLKNTYLIAQRIDDIKDYIQSAIDDIDDENENVKVFLLSLISQCEKAFEEQCLIFGTHVMTVVNHEMIQSTGKE